MGLSRHAKKFHVLRRIFPMFWRGSPGMMSYNAQKETYLRDLLPNDLIHGQLKREVLIQEEVTRVWVILISESVCFLEREFCQIWRSVAGRPPLFCCYDNLCHYICEYCIYHDIIAPAILISGKWASRVQVFWKSVIIFKCYIARTCQSAAIKLIS